MKRSRGGTNEASSGALQILFDIGSSIPLHRVHNSSQLTGQHGVLNDVWIVHFGTERFGFFFSLLEITL